MAFLKPLTDKQLIKLESLVGFSKGMVTCKFGSLPKQSSTISVTMSSAIWEKELDPVIDCLFANDEGRITADGITVVRTNIKAGGIKVLSIEDVVEQYTVVFVEFPEGAPDYIKVVLHESDNTLRNPLI